MGVDGVFNDRGAQADKRHAVEQDMRDPRFSFGRGGFAPSPEQEGTGPLLAKAAPLGDDSLNLSPEQPDNPFKALIDHRRRRKRRKHDGDPTSLD